MKKISLLLVFAMISATIIAQSPVKFTDLTEATDQSSEASFKINYQAPGIQFNFAGFGEAPLSVPCNADLYEEVFEDFTNNLIGPANVAGCGNDVLDCTTTDICYAAGGVECGFTVTGLDGGGGGELVLLTTGFLGAAIDFVGPNFFVDNFDVAFDEPTNRFAMDLASAFGGDDVLLNVYDDGGALVLAGVLTLPSVATPGQLEVFTSGPAFLSRAEFIDVTPAASALMGGLTWCRPLPPTVPTMGEWAIISLAIMLVIVGVVSMRQTETEAYVA